MFQVGSALNKLVDYFYVHPCTSKPAAAQEVCGHEACIVQKICGQACMAALACFFPETKSRRFENTVEATWVTVHCESLSFGPLDL
jgi:hypothetical protein